MKRFFLMLIAGLSFASSGFAASARTSAVSLDESRSAGQSPSASVSGTSRSPGEWLISLGAVADYQLAASGRTYETVVPLTVRVGRRFSFADVYGEYSYVSATSGAGLVSVGETNQEFLVWVRRMIPVIRTVSVYGALGGGVHVQSVASSVGTSVGSSVGTSVDKAVGQPEMLGAIATGVEWRLARSFSVGLEGRGSFSESYSPSPLLGLGGFLSILF